MAMNETESKISVVCDDIKELLIHKNRKYGNSALQPNRIFSKCSATEQLLVRIDDKLNRIMKGAGLLATDEDVVNDLIGYLVLLKISMASDKNHEILDTARAIYGDGISSGNIEVRSQEILDHARDFD
tara:strand:+ start:1346 stop:1729 length:384 start_codon:yes stop_codon:yes gene_type:complete